jgi:RimJ/RimL family protein N-acetyltransferase
MLRCIEEPIIQQIAAALRLYDRTVAGTPVIETSRLSLRLWQPSDRVPFALMNGDPRVMEFMPACLSPAESDAVADRIQAHFEQHGFGLYAAELRDEHRFIGFVGVSVPNFDAHFTPCVEIGWRLAAADWGRGFATEGASAVAAYAFENPQLNELVSFTVPMNTKSRCVMEKLGMTHDPSDDFDHPKLPNGHPLRRHVLYRLKS